MPLPTIPGVVRLAASGVVPSLQPWTNVWHFRYAGGASAPGDSDITALDTLFTRMYSGTAFGSGLAWLTNCPNGVTLAKMSYVRLDGSSLGLDIPKAIVGTGPAGATPSECAPVLTLRSNQRGRSHRGRIYLPCTGYGSLQSNGRLNTTVATSTVAQLQGLMTALGGPSVAPFWEVGIASYLLHVFTPLVLPTMDLDIDVQRRRKK